MKKVLSILIIAVMMVMALTVSSQADTQSDFVNNIYARISQYGATESDKVKIERYLSQYPITEEQANGVLAKADEAITLMKTIGASTFSELTKDQREQIKAIANEAASIVDVTLTYTNSTVNVYKNGTLIDSKTYSAPATVSGGSSSTATTSSANKLAYTGSNYNLGLIIFAIAGIALISAILTKKKIVNAR